MAFPTGAELAAYLVDAGVLSSVPADLDRYTALAVEAQAAWESATGISPFEREADDSTQYYHGSGQAVIPLRTTYMSITSVSHEGNTLTLNTDYWQEPQGASFVQSLMFDFRTGFEPRSVVVVGKRGRVVTLSADITEAVLAYGASLALPLLNDLGSMASSLKQDSISITMPGTSRLAAWKEQWDRAVARYRLYRMV